MKCRVRVKKESGQSEHRQGKINPYNLMLDAGSESRRVWVLEGPWGVHVKLLMMDRSMDPTRISLRGPSSL